MLNMTDQQQFETYFLRLKELEHAKDLNFTLIEDNDMTCDIRVISDITRVRAYSGCETGSVLLQTNTKDRISRQYW